MTEIEAIITPVLDRMGVNLVLGTYAKENGGKVLRLLIERKGLLPEDGSGVDLGLCSTVSREVSAVLDVDDVIGDAYYLEVSSPGIERPLVQQSDYERFSGRVASISTKGPVEGRRKFQGVICGFEKGAVIIELDGETRVAIPNELIKKSNLVFDAKV